eukprot:CAMPEP_0118633996 /NCGR_PEP_ID=MMETSP0785-20121206/1299_1 /TAXON_ID=91992 /ORGANISM="Bolidomonas pacifica, Strain CCMP 1866" /LENGTH=90 /DNA_ID=CAMNT_0006524917 /DNA_START=767 /DNA_END=1039 /DNA_ORIENTATION=+
MFCMVVTAETSHPLISALKVDLSMKRFDMSVTAEVSHEPIRPYVACAVVESSIQASTASCMLESVIGVQEYDWPVTVVLQRTCVPHVVPV